MIRLRPRNPRQASRDPARWVDTLLAYLSLARIHSATGAALAVWVGARAVGGAWEPRLLAPMAVALLLSAAGNAWNDAHDVACDAINRPGRPIPLGVIPVAAARRFALGCAGVALALVLPYGAAPIAGTVLGIALLLAYSTHLKAIPLVGNGMVGVLAGMALGFGGLLAGDVGTILLPAAALALLFAAREVVKTLHDVRGDRAVGLRTVATVAGSRGALAIATLLVAAALVSLALWAGDRPHGLVWLAPGALVAIPLLALWRGPEAPERVAAALGWSKVGALGVLVVLSLL